MNFKLGILILTLVLALLFAGCQRAQTSATNSAVAQTNTTAPVGPAIISDTPTEAYKNLYAAVKSKNTEAIRQNMSKTTQEFAEEMSQLQKKTIKDMYENGLIASTMSPNLPAMRDERMKDNFGALEVQNPDGTWQDVPFVKEGSWKVAVGDLFKNSYQSPGKPASQANANTNTPQMIPVPGNANTMGNINARPIAKPGIRNKPESK